jgi:hypothetical protein
MSSVYFEAPRRGRTGSKSSLAGPLAVLVLLVCALFASLYMIRNRGAGLASTVTLSVSPGNVRMLMEVNGRPFGGGKPIGFPVQLNLPPGQHSIVLSRPGIRTKQVEIKTSLAGGKINEQVFLERDNTVPTAQLRIITQPPGARVTNQEGWDVGGTTPHLFELMPINQKLRFRIQHPKCKPGSFEETLTRNDLSRTAVRKLELRDCTR